MDINNKYLSRWSVIYSSFISILLGLDLNDVINQDLEENVEGHI